MTKQELKRKLLAQQNEDVPQELWAVDVDRKKPKALGGIYTEENTRVLDPVEHMKRHGTFRDREQHLENMKGIVDDRGQVIKLRNKIANQIRAYKRGTDFMGTETLKFLEKQIGEIEILKKERDKQLVKSVKDFLELDSLGLAKAAMGVPSVGPVTVAHCLVYIDLEKAEKASSLWKYAGLHAPSHKRYKKGESGGGNKTLRCSLYTMADSQVKGRGPYRLVYDQVKTRLENSENMTESRNTQGKLVTCMWKEVKPSHRHGAALRAIMKHFLADYWFVGRTLMGLDTRPIYAESVLKGGHKTIDARFRGWILE